MIQRFYNKYRQSGVRGVTCHLLLRAADRIAISFSEKNTCLQQGTLTQTLISLQDVDPEAHRQGHKTQHSQPYIDFQQIPHKVLSRYITINEKHVLEVGGAQACISANAFLLDGAASVTVTGLDHISSELEAQDQRLRVMQANALDLSRHFKPSSFDIVYGLSILEHIQDPEIFLEEVYKVLKPGGIAYFEGYPLWSSALGHHLWVSSWGGRYKGKSSTNYLFCELSDIESTNPLPDWGHLLMTEKELQTYLDDQSLPHQDIQCIIDWIYHSSEVNRLTSKRIADAYTTSKLVVLEANSRRTEAPKQILEQLREKYGESCDYGISGFTYVLAKPQ